MKLFWVLVLGVCCACRPVPKTTALPVTEKVGFLVLSVSRQNSGQPSNVRVISTTVSEGTLKKTRTNAAGAAGNYITLYFYHNSALTDSVTLAHPLYKSLEYVADNNTFAVKDTVLREAEFFVRFKVTAPGTEIKITETLQPSPPRQIAFIKL